MENNQTVRPPLPFQKGMFINILEKLQIIDKALILEIRDKKVVIQSLQAFPGETSQFVLIGTEDGKTYWALMFKGLFDEPCVNERAPLYTMVPTLA